MSINLADELVNKQLVILLIFVNNEHFVNAVAMEKVSYANADDAWAGIRSKSNNSCIYPHKQWKLSTVQQICRRVDATGSAIVVDFRQFEHSKIAHH